MECAILTRQGLELYCQKDERGIHLGEPVESLEAMLPSSIISAARQRINRLAPPVITLLHTAAIIGRTFDSALLAEVTDQDMESA